jgi:hypothetical protein
VVKAGAKGTLVICKLDQDNPCFLVAFNGSAINPYRLAKSCLSEQKE